MENLIVSIILIVILGTAIGYIIKEKKKGTRCIGCPAAGNCKNARQCKCHQLSNDNDCI
ncbi:MAG: FeoB-associated Cys-rich membrane protein [Lachnospiraceae bacterium]|nr:FeoB-associated Cys-rich membrane protein [Lachnospiraceae bacterium]